eukprot:gnl/Trimastix_PCT/1420.p2 GENE.gnl/Trimastix_PCT/1420~~gnl/Trimastix_PCT/1420.p2  ORF type:complete len:491 (-),score=155.33 gnl/Trimastix_PCT/1420:52-1470(-)
MSQQPLYVFNAFVLTFDSEKPTIENGAMYCEGDQIVEVGNQADLHPKYFGKGHKEIDADGKVLMPSFICAHTHYYGMFSRGMALKAPEPPRHFLAILQELWWRLDRALRPEDIYISAMVCIISAIKAGTTTMFDHHASPNSIAGSLDQIARAALDAGVRVCLSYEVTDRNGLEGADAGIAENIRFMQRCAREANPLLAASFGLHACFTVSDRTMERCASALQAFHAEHPAAPCGVHIHVAEDRYDQMNAFCTANAMTGAEDKSKAIATCDTPIRRLHHYGLLGEHSICGHCVFVTDDDMQLIKETGTSVVNNPESNMNNGVGAPPALDMLAKGLTVGLGTDGITHDMMQEYRTNYLVHKLMKKDPRVMGGEGAQMLFKNNAKLAGKYFPQRPVGKLAAGAFADFILMDYGNPTVLSEGNLPWHVMFGFSSGDIDTTVCGGRVLMQNRRLQTIDEKAIFAEARRLCPGVWERF